MPGFASGGISKTQSPTGLSAVLPISIVTPRSGVDHDPRAPPLRGPLHAELVEGDGLGVGPALGPRGVDAAALEGRAQRPAVALGDLDLRLREHLLVPVLPVDQLRQ